MGVPSCAKLLCSGHRTSACANETPMNNAHPPWKWGKLTQMWDDVVSSARRDALHISRGMMVGAVLLLSTGCGVDCDGDDCGCHGQRECILSCSARDCDLSCSHTSESCGAICGDDCTFECHDTNHCSTLSGDGSDIDCHNVPSCAAECGANCNYEAHDVSTVDVTVGPGSTVECRNIANCDVTCKGPCELTCISVDSCDLNCDNGTSEEGSGQNRSCQ